MGPPCPGEARRAEAPWEGPGASEGPAGRVGSGLSGTAAFSAQSVP